MYAFKTHEQGFENYRNYLTSLLNIVDERILAEGHLRYFDELTERTQPFT